MSDRVVNLKPEVLSAAMATQRDIEAHAEQYAKDTWWEFQEEFGLTDEQLTDYQENS